MQTIYYEIKKTTSTNTKAKYLIPYLNQKALTIVLTYNQTDGRGKYNKTWISSNKDLTFTACFFVNTNSQNLDNALLFRLGTHAVFKLTQYFHINNTTIKWPNDVLINNKKLSGTLSETVPITKHLTAVLVGIGLNVNSSSHDLAHIDQPSTSLSIELDQKLHLNTVLDILVPYVLEESSILKQSIITQNV